MSHPARRTSPRLHSFDYRQPSYYFVTVCTKGFVCRLGTIRDGFMCLSTAGSIVAATWSSLPEVEPDLHLDAWVVMPNHLHGIIALHPVAGERAHDLSEIVGRFKAVSAREINRHAGRAGQPFWHRSFYDHVIRDDADLARIREYVANNPARWTGDRFYG